MIPNHTKPYQTAPYCTCVQYKCSDQCCWALLLYWRHLLESAGAPGSNTQQVKPWHTWTRWQLKGGSLKVARQGGSQAGKRIQVIISVLTLESCYQNNTLILGDPLTESSIPSILTILGSLVEEEKTSNIRLFANTSVCDKSH